MQNKPTKWKKLDQHSVHNVTRHEQAIVWKSQEREDDREDHRESLLLDKVLISSSEMATGGLPLWPSAAR